MCFEISSAPSAEPLSWTRVISLLDAIVFGSSVERHATTSAGSR